jgi:hypothetical protein
MIIPIPTDKIDLSECHLGIDIPVLEESIREIAKEFIQGVLENGLRLDLVIDEEDGKIHVALWGDLTKDGDDLLAWIPIQDLINEYIAESKEIERIKLQKPPSQDQ